MQVLYPLAILSRLEVSADEQVDEETLATYKNNDQINHIILYNMSNTQCLLAKIYINNFIF